MTTDSPLFQMNPTSRFSDRADDYARFRPSYPSEAVDAMLAGLDPTAATAADIGAGTGISARLLADRGVRVHAIEPNAAMRESSAPHALVQFHDGTAEATGLEPASVDLVLCAQAFHWFEPVPALTEFRRLLKRSGRLALLWNDRDSRDPATAEYGRLVRLASQLHPASADREPSADALNASPLFTGVQTQFFPYNHDLTLEGLIGRARSASYVPNDGPRLNALIDGLTLLYTRFADSRGIVPLVYLTRLHTAHPRTGI